MRHILFACGVAALLGACQSAPVVPTALQPEAGLTFSRTVRARGVQIYECRSASGTHAWAFVAPEAALADVDGQPFGRHYAGPHWEAPDGSKVVATLKARSDAPAADAIPWLLLSARSVGGPGAFSLVRAIQRVNTVGGSAPREACSATSAGQIARVPYTADYHLYAARP